MSLAELKLISNEMDRRQGIALVIPPLVRNKNYLPEIKELTKRIETVENRNAELASAFWNLFKYSKVGFCKVSIDSYFVEVNDAWCGMVHRTREELLGLTWQEITMPEYIPTDEVNVQKLIAGEISTYTMYKEYFYIVENGEKHIIRLDLTVSCVFDKAQNLLYFISEAVDWERRL